MFYNDIDFEYLDKAVRRARDMLVKATSKQAVPWVDPNLNPPFWWVYLGELSNADRASDVFGQIWPVQMRYVAGYATQGYDGNLQRSVHIDVAKAVCFFQAYRRLVYENLMEPPPYLGENVRVEIASLFGLFQDESGHIGMEIRLILPFDLVLDQEF